MLLEDLKDIHMSIYDLYTIYKPLIVVNQTSLNIYMSIFINITY